MHDKKRQARSKDSQSPAPRRAVPRRLVAIGLAVLVAALALIAVAALWRAQRAGKAGRLQLALAEKDLLAQQFGAAHQDLLAAGQDFRAMRSELHGFPFGPSLAVWRAVPLVRVQVRAVDTFADIGVSLSAAGLRITDAAATINKPSGGDATLSASLDKLRTAQASLQGGQKVLDAAAAKIRSLSGYRLFGPIGSAQREAAQRITRIEGTARSAEQAVTALIAFSGGDGPRRYIVLSQNPDELRPTGGFMGSYGVLAADGGHVRLERYDDSVTWVQAHPSAVIPADQLGSPFRFYDPPLDQTFANVNAVPDWPQVAQVALKLWQQGGEAPADGVVSFTPQFLARVLAVTGPVAVPSYNDTVTAANVVAKLDFYTHGGTKPPPGTNRKEFLSVLGQVTMAKLLDAPPSQWRGLGSAVAKAFTARELSVWSRDPAVQTTLAARAWDGAFPARTGDFFYDSEFEYGAKNGRGLKRTIDDTVALRADGSAQITTTITINNTAGPSLTNDNVLTYYTLYGPAGAVLNADASDPPFATEAALAGHPAAGWFRTVSANSTGTIKVVWDVPALAEHRADGSWQYALNFLHLVDNTGDTLNLKVELPARARWVGKAPPAQAILDHDVTGVWAYRISG